MSAVSGELAKVTDADNCVFANLLNKWASSQPDKVFAHFYRETSWTYAQTLSIAQQTAHSLRKLGVKQGDFVLCWLPNGPDILKIWLGLNLLGAVYVPLNTSYRGGLLEHVIKLTGAKLLIGHAQLLGRLADIDTGALSDLVAVGENAPAAIGSLNIHSSAVLERGEDKPVETERPIEAWDNQSVIFTSGTTGPSKAVLSTYAHLHAQSGEAFAPFTQEDCYFLDLPLCHVAGTIPVGVALANGASVGVIESFHPSTFWDAIDEMGCTWAYVVLAMPRLLMEAPESPADKQHALTNIIISSDTRDFCKRFNVQGWAAFGMSEICTPTFTEHSLTDETLALSCGKMRPGIEARLVDAHDNEVPIGEVGELIMRTARPYMFSHEYLNNPEATAKAWRNGWFHSGDLMRVDKDGNYFFVDRLKDAIRRRGENISSFEVEAAVATYPPVREVAAIPVKDEIGDEEVMVVVSCNPGADFNNGALIEHLRRSLPHFMVPRYVRMVENLPRTETGKVKKMGLVDDGVTPDTWDRESEGIIIKRQALS